MPKKKYYPDGVVFAVFISINLVPFQGRAPSFMLKEFQALWLCDAGDYAIFGKYGFLIKKLFCKKI